MLLFAWPAVAEEHNSEAQSADETAQAVEAVSGTSTGVAPGVAPGVASAAAPEAASEAASEVESAAAADTATAQTTEVEAGRNAEEILGLGADSEDAATLQTEDAAGIASGNDTEAAAETEAAALDTLATGTGNNVRSYLAAAGFNPEIITVPGSLQLSFQDKNGTAIIYPPASPDAPQVTVGSKINFRIGLSVPDDITPQIKAGDYYDITLPDNIAINQGVSNVPMYSPEQSDDSGLLYGHFDVVPGNAATGTPAKVHIVFTDGITGKSGVHGSLFFQGNFNPDTLDQPGSTTIQIPQESNLVATVNLKPQTSSNIEKSGTPNRTNSPTEITWTVVANRSLRDVHNITITDEFPHYIQTTNIENTTVVQRVDVDLYGEITGVAETLTPGPADGQYSIDADGTVVIHGSTPYAYRVIYTTPIDTDAITQTGGSYSFTNKASLASDEINEPVHATATVKANYGKKLEKLATGQTTETVPGHSPMHRPVYNFAIRYNYNEGEIPEADNYVDDIYDPAAAGESVSQAGNMGFDASSLVVYQVYYDANGNPQRGAVIPAAGNYTLDTSNPGRFRVQFIGDNQGQAYLLTYSCHATGDTAYADNSQYISSNYTVRNTATIGGNNPPSSSVTTTVRQQGIVKKLVASDEAAKVLTWQVDLNELRYATDDLTFTDTLTPGNGAHWIILGNVPTAGPPVIKDVSTSPQKTLVLNTDYTIETMGNPQVVTIRFIGSYSHDMTHQLRLTYSTGYDVENEPTGTKVANSAEASWSTDGTPYSAHSSASFTPNVSDNSNGFKQGSYNPTTRTITWDVYLGYAETPLKNGVFTDQIISPSATAIQTYVPESLHIYHYTITNGDPAVVKGKEATPAEYASFAITDPSAANDNTITVRFPDIATPEDGDDGNLYMIEYQTSLAGSEVAAEYTNTAHFHNDNSTDHDLTASVTPPYGGQLADKSGKLGQDGYLYWTVLINPSQSTVANVVVHDVPAIYANSSQTIQTSTIQVCAGQASSTGAISAVGAPLTDGVDYEWTYATNTTGQPVMSPSALGKPELVLKLHPGGNTTIDQAYVLTFRCSLMITSTNGSVHPYNNVVITSDASEAMNHDAESNVAVDVFHAGGMLVGELTSFTLTKKASGGSWDGQAMDGVTFRLFDKNGNQVGADRATDAAGHIVYNDLVAGKYTLQEVDNGAWAGRGYAISSDLISGISINVTADGALTITNSLGKLRLHKVDEQGNALSGATFSLEMKQEPVDAASDQTVPYGDGWTATPSGFMTNYTVDAAGLIEISGLPAGTYRFVESVAPLGYIVNREPIEFTLDDPIPALTELYALNRQGSVEFTKVMELSTADELNGQPLADAGFILSNKWNDGGQDWYADIDGDADPSLAPTPEYTSAEVFSGTDGKVRIDGLAPGNYYLWESAVPNGYLDEVSAYLPVLVVVPAAVDTAADTVVVPAGLPEGKWPNLLREAAVFLYKGDGATDAMLAGAEFDLYESEEAGVFNDPPVRTGVKSNSNGLLSISHLGDLTVPAQTTKYYRLVEKVAPEGYLVNSEPIDFAIVPEGGVLPAKTMLADVCPNAAPYFANYQGSARIRKAAALADGSPGEYLAGAVFAAYLDDGDADTVDPQIATATTDATGTAVLTGLPVGRPGADPVLIAVREIQAPAGYLINSEAIDSFAYPTAAVAGEPDAVTLTSGTAFHGGDAVLDYLGRAQLLKQDQAHGPVKGAEFTLYAVGGGAGAGAGGAGSAGAGAGGGSDASTSGSNTADVKIGTYTTDSQGKTPIIEGLQVGSYYFVETKVPTGYQLPGGVSADKRYSFTIGGTFAGQPAPEILTVTNINKSLLPKTGDATPYLPTLAALLAFGSGATLITIYRHRRHKRADA
ncbi:MAG: hypothetical protein LBR39_08355 [Coriobacteriales bacterium]|nr:hypothetical protein [Coriobacteriales bacterium]